MNLEVAPVILDYDSCLPIRSN